MNIYVNIFNANFLNRAQESVVVASITENLIKKVCRQQSSDANKKIEESLSELLE